MFLYISPSWYIVVLLVIVVVFVVCLFSVVACYFFWWWLVDWLLSFLLTCSDIAAGIPLDKDHVIHFFCSCQLLVRELHKSYRLIQRKPLDMTSFYGEMLLSLEPNLNAKYTGTLATGRKLYKHEILIQFMSSRRQQQKKNSLGRGLDATRWNNFSAHPTEICLYNVCFFSSSSSSSSLTSDESWGKMSESFSSHPFLRLCYNQKLCSRLYIEMYIRTFFEIESNIDGRETWYT
jgi:hypothetical protein